MSRSHKDTRFFISTTVQPVDLDRAGYEALTFVEVKKVGSHPESGTTDNIISYDTLDQEVTDKAKGIADAGGGELELSRVHDDPGQIALRAAAKTNFNYAFKTEYDDAPDPTMSNTILYNRGLVSGPRRPGGRNEDFILESFTLAFVQIEVEVAPAVI